MRQERYELIQPMANGVWGTATAFVVSRAPAVIDPKKRHAATLQHGARIEAMGFDAVSDPRHPFCVGEVGGVDRFEQVEESVEHEPGFWGFGAFEPQGRRVRTLFSHHTSASIHNQM